MNLSLQGPKLGVGQTSKSSQQHLTTRVPGVPAVTKPVYRTQNRQAHTPETKTQEKAGIQAAIPAKSLNIWYLWHLIKQQIQLKLCSR